MSAITMKGLSNSSLIKAGLAAVVAAVLANVVARLLVGALVPLTPDFPPFGYGPIVLFTTIFTLIGVGVLALVNRFSSRPLRVYNIIAVVAFFVSIVPNLAAYANPAAMPMGGSGSDYLVLIFFHVVAAVAFLGTLNTLARKD